MGVLSRGLCRTLDVDECLCDVQDGGGRGGSNSKPVSISQSSPFRVATSAPSSSST